VLRLLMIKSMVHEKHEKTSVLERGTFKFSRTGHVAPFETFNRFRTVPVLDLPGFGNLEGLPIGLFSRYARHALKSFLLFPRSYVR